MKNTTTILDSTIGLILKGMGSEYSNPFPVENDYQKTTCFYEELEAIFAHIKERRMRGNGLYDLSLKPREVRWQLNYLATLKASMKEGDYYKVATLYKAVNDYFDAVLIATMEQLNKKRQKGYLLSSPPLVEVDFDFDGFTDKEYRSYLAEESR